MLTVSAQQPAASRPVAPAGASSAAPGEAKIALINTSAFGDEKAGILKFIAAIKRVDGEFQPRRTELQGLRTRYDALVKQINDTKAVADQAALAKSADDAEVLKRDIERKGQDAQLAYEKRMREVLNPLQEDVYKNLETFARARGITLIIDASQVPVLYATDNLDITRA
ncbi:MAG TPA: OmpH family outer membrane protein, partial [Pyrinomonadaceae bacterium]|nr:OmpH family outer membrane protein [Pyrinomonadaceae bacterium]